MKSRGAGALSSSAYIRHWWPQESNKKTDGKSGALEAALCSFQKRLSLAQRNVTMRILSACRTF